MKTRKVYIRYSRQAISAVTSVVLATGIILACSDFSGFWDWETPVFFQPDIADQTKPNELFYYTRSLLNTGHDEWGQPLALEPRPDYHDNIDNWYQQLGGNVSKAYIDSFLYNSPDFIWTEAPSMKKFMSIYGNKPLIKHLVETRNKNALKYLLLAKANEFGTDRLNDGWNFFPPYDYYSTDSLPSQSPSTHNVVTEMILEGLHQSRDTFYRQRYAYQLIRKYRYTYYNTGVDSLFQLYFASAAHNYLYHCAMNYAADALVNNHEQAKANYYASLVFHALPEKKYRAYKNFDNKVPVDLILPYCTSDKEKSMVYAMYAFKDFYPNSYYISQALKLDPANTSISDLIIREVNKIDERLLPDYSSRYDWYSDDGENVKPAIRDENGEVVRLYPEESDSYKNLLEMLQQLRLTHTENKDFYSLCLAHLCLLENNTAAAYTYMNAITEATLTQKLKAQYHLTKVLLHIHSRNLRNPLQQDILNTELEYLETHQNDYYRKNYVLNGVRVIASKKLLHDNDYARAYFMSMGITDMYGDYDILENHARPEDIDTILDIVANPRSDFDKKISRYNTLNHDDLRNIQGSLYVRANRMNMALKSFTAATHSYIPVNFSTLNTNPDGNPFYPYNYEPITSDPNDYYTQQYIDWHNERALRLRLEFNNYSIVKEITVLQEKIRKKQGDPALHYFNLASLYFELTYHGRAYRIMNYKELWSMNEIEYLKYMKKRPSYWVHYYGCEWSVPYYKLALKYSKDKELTAKCLYALFRCNRFKQRYYDEKNATNDLDYLFRMHDQYANTEYYRIKECWGLSAYVSELRSNKTKNVND
jgi:hypothetical protein